MLPFSVIADPFNHNRQLFHISSDPSQSVFTNTCFIVKLRTMTHPPHPTIGLRSRAQPYRAALAPSDGAPTPGRQADLLRVQKSNRESLCRQQFLFKLERWGWCQKVGNKQVYNILEPHYDFHSTLVTVALSV